MRDATAFQPRIGRPPRSTLVTTDGQPVQIHELLRSRPALIVCASITCPMAAAASTPLLKLYRQYHDRVTFVTLYTREAHPGQRYGQAETMARKLELARAYQERDRIPWMVVVDDLDGTFHLEVDPKPNAAFFLDQGGRIVFRALWANDVAGMKRGFARLLSDETTDVESTETKLLPMARGLAALDRVLGAAGRGAREDFRRTAPTAYAVGWCAGRVANFPRLARRRVVKAWAALLGLTGASMERWRAARRLMGG